MDFVSLRTPSLLAKKFTGEPIFAPKMNANGEDDGYILVVVYDAEKDSSSLAIMDAKNIVKGPVAEIQLPARLPYGLHGSWVQPEVTSLAL